jgi:hypothetical protein
MAHIFVKHTVWQKITLDPKDSERLEDLNKNDNLWQELVDSAIDFEVDYDSLEYMTPKENADQETVEVYNDSGECVWTNRDKIIVRQEKIEALLNK